MRASPRAARRGRARSRLRHARRTRRGRPTRVGDLRARRRDEMLEERRGDVLLGRPERAHRLVEVRADDPVCAARGARASRGAARASRPRISSSHRRVSTSWRYGVSIRPRRCRRRRPRPAPAERCDLPRLDLVEHRLDELGSISTGSSPGRAGCTARAAAAIASRAGPGRGARCAGSCRRGSGSRPLKRSSFASASSRIEIRKLAPQVRGARRRAASSSANGPSPSSAGGRGSTPRTGRG